MTDKIHVGGDMSIENGHIDIERYMLPVDVDFRTALRYLDHPEMSVNENSESSSPPMIKIVGYDAYYYLKFGGDNEELTQMGAKDGNCTRLGDYHVEDGII